MYAPHNLVRSGRHQDSGCTVLVDFEDSAAVPLVSP
jgi:hypothetical protein